MSLKINNTKQEAPEFVYPLAFQALRDDLVVVFVGLNDGFVVVGNSVWKIGGRSTTWVDHTNAIVWKPVSITIEAP